MHAPWPSHLANAASAAEARVIEGRVVAVADGDTITILDRNNSKANLATLCPTCHRMHDIGLISKDFIKERRDNPPKANWRMLIGDASERAQATIRKKKIAKKRRLSRIARQATQKRRENAEARKR